MAEEVHSPSVDLPRAIVWSIPIEFMTGAVFLLPLVFTLPDVAILLAGIYIVLDFIPVSIINRYLMPPQSLEANPWVSCSR